MNSVIASSGSTILSKQHFLTFPLTSMKVNFFFIHASQGLKAGWQWPCTFKRGGTTELSIDPILQEAQIFLRLPR
jgi:hypothetical protein